MTINDNHQTGLTIASKPKARFMTLLDKVRSKGFQLKGQNDLIELMVDLFEKIDRDGSIQQIDKKYPRTIKDPGQPTSVTVREKVRSRFRLAKAKARVLGFRVKTDWQMLVFLMDVWKQAGIQGPSEKAE